MITKTWLKLNGTTFAISVAGSFYSPTNAPVFLAAWLVIACVSFVHFTVNR